MKTKNIAIMTLAALLWAGCSQEELPAPQQEEGVMSISALYPGARTRATESGFENGDKIGIYVTDYNGETASPLQISGNWANNVAATYDGSAWSTSKKIYWSDNKMDVYGYYPYLTPTSIDEHPFSIALDQSTERTADALGGYEASDFLWAKAEGVSQSEETVALQFKHRCSKLIVQLVKGSSYDGDFPAEAELFIHNVVPSATIDFTTGAVVRDIYAEPVTIKARQVNAGRYEAILIPQRVTSRRPFIELIANGVSYLLEDTFQFKAGVQHTISFTINSNPSQVEIEIGGEIEGGEW